MRWGTNKHGILRISDPRKLQPDEVEVSGYVATYDHEKTQECNPEIDDPEEMSRIFSFIDSRGVKVLFGPDWPPWMDNLTCEGCGGWWRSQSDAWESHDDEGQMCEGDANYGRYSPLNTGRKPMRRCSDMALTDEFEWDMTPVWPSNYFEGTKNPAFARLLEVVEE